MAALYIRQIWLKIRLIMRGCVYHAKEQLDNHYKTLFANKCGNERLKTCKEAFFISFGLRNMTIYGHFFPDIQRYRHTLTDR